MVIVIVDAGVPPVAMVQMLRSGDLDEDAVARFGDIMRREGITEEMLIAQEVQAPLRWFREVFPDLDVGLATHLGLSFAERAQLTSFGPLTLPLLSAGSVAEIVELFTYLPLITDALSTQFSSSNNGLVVGLSGHTGDVALDCLAVSYGGSALLTVLDLLTGDVSGVKMHLAWPEPVGLKHHDAIRARWLTFDAPVSFLALSATALEEVCRFSDPIAYRTAIESLRETLNERRGLTSCSQRVRRVLETATDRTSSRSVADTLSMSSSTLKRRLQEEGTTFRDLREVFLRERAILHLLDRETSISQIATDLGYSDLTNFSHAFKRWTGLSPGAFRRQQHVDQPD